MREPGFGNTQFRLVFLQLKVMTMDDPFVEKLLLDFIFQEANEVFWGEGRPDNSSGNSLDCAHLALEENNHLVWKDISCGWVLKNSLLIECNLYFVAIQRPSVKI